MNKNLMKRLIALVLTGGILLSSTGVYTALAATEETTTSEYTSALVGSDETATTEKAETTVPSTTEPATSEATSVEETTEKATENVTEATTTPPVQKPETTTSSPVMEEEVTQKPSDNKAVEWVGVNGTSSPGTEEDPYAVSSVAHLLAMNDIINEGGHSAKYFELTADIDFAAEGVTVDTALLQQQAKTGMEYSLVSVNPSLSSSSVFFVLDGKNHKISNLTMSSSDLSSMSIFGYINSASSVSNVYFNNISITNSYSDAMAAGIFLKNEGSVEDCLFTNVTIDTSASASTAESFYPTADASLRVYAGTAIVVDNSGVIECSTNYDLTAATKSPQVEKVTITTSRKYAGTLVAQNRGRINKVRVRNFTVTGNKSTSDYVGGLVGANLTSRSSASTGVYYAELLDFSDNGGVTGADKIGYLVGYNTGRIWRSAVNGSFKSNTKATATNYDLLVYGAKSAGGIVGYNTGDVQYCSALNIGVYFADVGNNTVYGGIVGTAKTYGVRNCVATGSTAGDGTGSDVVRYVGGIIGLVETPSSSFSVENCYALVKILESKADLGAIIGYNGDEVYKSNKVRNVFYSSIISTRPSPVSYGAVGEAAGDLVFSKPYDAAYNIMGMGGNYMRSVTANASDFTFSGWGEASVVSKGNFTAPVRPTNSTFTGSSSTMTYQLTNDGAYDRTVVYYDTEITLPSEVGNTATVLSAEPMEFTILNAGSAIEGTGTKSNPFKLKNEKGINFLYYAPAAYFEADTDIATEWAVIEKSVPPITFWGNVDFGGITITYNVDEPIFKGIYGSRDDSLVNNNSTTHVSTPTDDTADNLAYGVVENVTVTLGTSSMSAVFGNICNATVKNATINFAVNTNEVKATDSNTGLFAKSVYGNSYLYGCYVDSTQNNQYKITSSYNAVSGFIGTVDAEKAIIDNCGANIVVYSERSGATNCSVFIGKIKSLDGGYIQNCYAAGGVCGSLGSSNNHLFVGETASSSTEIHNCVYSTSDYYKNNRGVSTGIKSGSFTGSCKAWSFIQENSSTQEWNEVTLQVSTGNDKTHVATINNLKKFDVDTYSSTTSLGSYFTASTNNSNILTDISVGWYGRVRISYSFTGAANTNADLYVTHNATGLMARLTVFNSSELAIEGGYYLIKTPIDLYYLSSNQTKQSNNEYIYMNGNAKIKLAADIDMSGYTIDPIGSSSIYFKGEFVADKGTDGEYYTISNLTFTRGQALFGNVQGAVIKGVHLDNANINSATYTAALVGKALDGVRIEDCKITNSNISGTNHVGAILGGVQTKDDETGSVSTVIKNCTVENTTVTSTKPAGQFVYIGGIAGGIGQEQADSRSAQILGCTVSGSNISANGYGIGGIVGYAPNKNNIIEPSKDDGGNIDKATLVTGTTITCNGTNGLTYSSLGGIAGIFGGSSISSCDVVDSTITGDCAAGIVTRLTNEEGTTSTVSDCTVTNTKITSDNIAAGILSQISGFATSLCKGEKVITNCKLSEDTTVKSLVAGGMVGNVQSFSDKVLTISGCTNLGTVETTGKKGSIYDGAGGIVGRFSSGLSTSSITITNCLFQGTVSGASNLGGILGVHSGNAHSGSTKLISNCYVTGKFTSKNLAVVKGLIIGYVGAANKSGASALSQNVYYSSLDTKVPLFGNVNVSATIKKEIAYDMNLGADQTRGLTLDLPTTIYNAANAAADLMLKNNFYPILLHSIVGYEDGMLGESNVIELKTNFYIGQTEYEGKGTKLSNTYNGTTYTMVQTATNLAQNTVPRFSVGNRPECTGTDGNAFAVPSSNVFKTNAKSTKLLVGCSTKTGTATETYNKLDDVNIQTFDKSCQASVYTTYTGVVNGETVVFKVGFTVIVNGEHAFDGAGTQDDPFKIYDADDLLSIKRHHDTADVNTKDEFYGNPDKYYAEDTYYEVADNIDMSEVLSSQDLSFAPIGGNADEPFKAHISSTSGQQFTISNMYINGPTGPESYAYNNYHDADKYSDALGVFGYTDGAEISNLIFENVLIKSVASYTNGYLGARTGAVVGQASNTTITNVDVTGTVNIEITGSTGDNGGAVGGIIGKADDAVVLSDVSVSGSDNENRANISALYMVGGIVGSAADTTGCSITEARVENLNVTNSATSGVSIAGGIAGQYSGTITGTYVEDVITEVVNGEEITKTVTVRNPVVVNNVKVTATVVGGAVGSGNINNLVSGGCDLTIKAVDVTSTVVEVTSDVRTNSNSVANGVAGGILGSTYESYHYLIEDCTVDSMTSIITGYCAGGIVGRANNRGDGSLQSETSLLINKCKSYASVSQLNAPITSSIVMSSAAYSKIGVGSVIGVISSNAYVKNKSDNSAQIQITDTTAGGEISGTFNLGGFIGEFATTQGRLYEMNESIIQNCILTAKLAPLTGATERIGIILGSVEGNTKHSLNPDKIPNQVVPFPEADSNGNTLGYAVRPFDKIFYSSYSAGNYNLYGLSDIQNYNDPDPSWDSELSGYCGSDVFKTTIYDVNQVAYNFEVDGQDEPVKLPISVVSDGFTAGHPELCYQWFSDNVYVFTDDFEAILAENQGSGTPFGFTIAGEDFVLAENGVAASDENIFKVIANPDSNSATFPYKITVVSYGEAHLVFTYTNGLQIAIPVICGVNFEGEGTTEDPIQVANEDIFYHIVKVLPGYSFIQTADLDFSDSTKYPASSVASIISNFTGYYNGNNKSISNFNINIESAETPVGIFGNIKGTVTDSEGNVVPNVHDLTFINCTVNGGANEAGTGVFAGAVSDGATVKNITVQGSTVTSSTGPVGGAIGKISGASTVDGVTIESTTVSTAKGEAGGVAGVMTDDMAVINSPKVTGSTITAGKVSEGTFLGGANNEDIAGGIVAQALGTINGLVTTDENGKNLLSDAVSGTTVQAFVSGGAVGAVYNLGDSVDHTLNLNNVKVSETNVVAKSTENTRTAMSAAGLLGIARGTTKVTLNGSFVDKASTVTSQHYAGGAVAFVRENILSLDIVDTETYASVSATEARNDGEVYVGGMIGYITGTQNKSLDLNIIKMNGSVAGGKITGKAMKTYVAGVIGGFNTTYITEPITTELFVNGVISATVECIDGTTDSVQSAVHRRAKFIAGYDEGDTTPVFESEYIGTMFSGNYYSTYPQDILFFATATGERGDYDAQILNLGCFENINVPGSVLLSDVMNGDSWNSVAITKEKNSDTVLYTKLALAELPYGSKDENGEYTKESVVSKESINLVAVEGQECIEFGGIYDTEYEGVYEIIVTPTDYGAENLVVEYDCGLATTATVLSVEILGEGSAEKPFLIGTPTQLKVVSYLTGKNYYFKQINDIDLSDSYNTNGTETDKFINYNGGKGFAPIGSETSAFDGVYDGQGYKITGMYINRTKEDNVGLFGVIRQNGTLVPTVMNVHLELMEEDGSKNKANGIVGQENVGGIVGKIENGAVINSSVVIGAVTGQNKVGGIAGLYSDSTITNCFTQSDVNAFGLTETKPHAGGIVGVISSGTNGAKISGCFASGSIYATPVATSNDISNAAGIVSYIEAAQGLEIDNCIFTGTTASGYGIFAGAGATNMSYKVTDCIDAGQNVAMAAGNIFSKLNSAVAPTALTGVTFEDVYYDSALLKLGAADARFTALNTSKLIDSVTANKLGDGWNIVAGNYPVPVVSDIKVIEYDKLGNPTNAETATETPDPYSSAYARFLSLPVQVSEAEECNDTTASSYGKGLVYPVTLLTSIDGERIIYSSSVFDTSDTVNYPEGFDTHLYGTDYTKTDDNMNVDLLFDAVDTETGELKGYTSVYRNIFDTTINIVAKTENSLIITKNTRVNAGAGSGAVFSNGEAYYNTQVPVVYAKAVIDGVTVYREIKIPLSYGDTYPIATQRQLYALGRADYEIAQPNSKFGGYYNSAYNYKLITDIDCGNNTTLFTPIGSETTTGYTGQFDGSGHTIKNLKIKSTGDYVGMFSKVTVDYSAGGTESTYAFVKNLTLEDATVEGGSYVGALIGSIPSTSVKVDNCHAIGGSVTGTGSYVGGLIGRVEWDSDTINACSASNTVSGTKDAVGGLIGDSSGQITSCYATGNVICEELTDGNICGVGGLIGIMTKGTVTESFASGNVEVKAFNTNAYYNKLTSGQFGVGGFVGYVAKDDSATGEVITRCFSGGNVSVGTDEDNKSSIFTANAKTAIVGVGGFSGINYEAIGDSYSSAAVTATFGSIMNNYSNATYGVGVGGVCGVALANVHDVYSSGSVAPAYESINKENGAACHYGVGGTIGTTMASGASCEYCYFDRWTNTDPNLTSIGGQEDTPNAKSLTTTELTNGTKPEGNWNTEVWGFTTSAYPYLKALLVDAVDPFIKTNAILSVVCMFIDEDDVSAKKGNGITMALTVPKIFSYKISEESTVSESLYWGNTTGDDGNLIAINRTKNVAEYIDIPVNVVGYEEYGTRTYRRLCADMKGTYAQPYLIGNETDLAHVNMTAEELKDAVAAEPDFYGQWATPLDEGNNQVEGTVYYQLMSNVIVSNARNIPSAPEKYTYKVTEYTTDADGNQVTQEKEKDFEYKGFVFNGNAYSIKNVSTTGTYFANLDDKSMITNMIFENLTFTDGTGNALIGTNNGKIYDVYVKSSVGDGTTDVSDVAGLTLTNNGLIEGCVVDITLKGAKSNVGVMARTNNGTIRNSGTAGTITTATGDLANIGAFVADNAGSIESSFSMADIDVLTPANATINNLSGFAAKSSGTIDSVYTRSAISFENAPASTTVASLVGKLENSSADSVTNSYAAGLLGYFNDAQDSILFGEVPDNFAELDSVYVDKSLAGQASYNSFKYSTSTSNLLSMQYMASSMKYDEMNEDEATNGKFVAGAESTMTFPQLQPILSAVNTELFDEAGEPVVFEDGFIIRNYDVIKAYSNISSMTIKTAQSLYADRLVPNSASVGLNATISNITDTRWMHANSLISVYNSNHYFTTGSAAGDETIRAYYSNDNGVTEGITLSRSKVKIYPQLLIDLAISAEPNFNPNFESGLGTKTNPYIITDADSLQSLYYYGTESTLYFALGNDIDVPDVAGQDYNFRQIPVFTAHLNEGITTQYAIENLKPAEGGLFGIVDNAVINNIALAGAVVKSDNLYTGALADRINGSVVFDEEGAIVSYGSTITNCVVAADVTSSSTDVSAATGVLAGRVYGNGYVDTEGNVYPGVVISSIVTTGNAVADAGVAGGVIGSVESAEMSEFVSTANVTSSETVKAGGIVGSMTGNEQVTTTLTNAFYGGVSKNQVTDASGKVTNKSVPFVAELNGKTAVSTVYYDNQLNSGVDETISFNKDAGVSTTNSAYVFEEDTENFHTFENGGYYPIPKSIANALASSGTSSYAATAVFAVTPLKFYKGSNRGGVGNYSSMQIVGSLNDVVTKKPTGISYDIDVTQNAAEDFFDISQSTETGIWAVSVKVFDKESDPTVTITLSNGAQRTINPGLVKTVKVSYEMMTSDADLFNNTKSLGVLIKSVENLEEEKADALNDFISVNEIKDGAVYESAVNAPLDKLILPESANGFYVGDMLPAGYEYKITAKLVDPEDENNFITLDTETHEGVYGTFVSFDKYHSDETDNNTTEEYDVRLTLEVVKVTETPWGVRSRNSNIW